MTKSTITRERLEKIKSWRETYGAGNNVMLPAEEAEELARIALAAMDSEPAARMVVIPTIWKHYTAAKTATIYEKAMTDAGIEWRSIDD
ncbi:hypothetical protein KAT64_15175 [Klebsiella oxytoca]|uniref:hypothetical protein n=1 Tax=Klebsiella oxytoca TaxID=571 RepID=UPI001B33F10A|nr:hypothetical protein [Klebsiella oxytoca]ELR9654036.1 hypothetical protein [Klebsiella oxytoca]QTV86294.1 hypothetical protein KAT64_15175 [Klebsiella oxytoca]